MNNNYRGYIDALGRGDYKTALSLANTSKYTVVHAYSHSLDDDPEFIHRLIENGAANHFEQSCFYNAFEKPKMLLSLMVEHNQKPIFHIIENAINCHFRVAATIMIENAKFIEPGPSQAYQLFLSGLMDAKRATYALLKSHRLLKKDVTRLIAKLVWASRADERWEIM